MPVTLQRAPRRSARPFALPGLLELAVLLILGAVPPGAASAAAQAPGGPVSDFDASVAPRGTFRFRAAMSWTRIDEMYGASSDGRTRALGSLFSADSLGTRQLPALLPMETSLQSLTGNSTVRINLGQLSTNANSRVVQLPMAVEYGLTNRLALTLMVPFVETRTTVLPSMNQKGKFGNVGLNPRQFGTTGAVVAQLQTDATQLSSALSACQANPGSSSNCSNLLAHSGDVSALVASATSFATGLTSVYGTSASTPGQAFVPITGTALDSMLTARLSGFNTQFQSFIPGAPTIGTALAGAGGPIARNGLDSLLGPGSVVALDSLGTPSRIGIGDIEVGAAYQLFDRLGDTAAVHQSGVRARAAVGGVLRLGTGAPPDLNVPYDLGTGQGQTDIEGRAALDLRLGGRLGATVSGLYSYQLTSAHLVRAPAPGGSVFPLTAPVPADWKPGNVFQLEIDPRFFATEYLSITALYAMRHVGDDQVTPGPSRDTTLALRTPAAAYVWQPGSTEQRFGIGFTYSALESFARGQSRLPLEISWVHMETVHGSGLVPKYFRDQVGFRLYYRWKVQR